MFQRFRSFSLAATLGFAALCAAAPSCSVQSDFQCSTDQDCLTQGDGGVCESNAFCSFPDPECVGGRRWHDRASSLAGECVGDESMTATDTDQPTDTEASSTAADASGETTDTPTTEAPTTEAPTTEDPTNATTDDPTTGDPTTGDPTTGDDSTGAAATCDDLYGASTDYMFCAEEVDSCSFSVTIAMASSCDAVCAAGGGTCVGADLNEDPVCTATAATTCDDMTPNDLICVCSRP